MVFNKKKGAMMKRNANQVSSKVIKKNKKVEDDEFEDMEDSTEEMFADEDEGGDMRNQSSGNLKIAKGKLTPSSGRKDMHVSFQLPNKGSSTVKTPKSLQNALQSGKKNLKPNTPMPTKKKQLGTPNTTSPVSFKKQSFVPKNQSLVFSGEKNQQSAKQTNLKQFPGMNSSLNEKGKSDSEISAADSDNEEDDEEEEDDDEEEEDDDEEEEGDEQNVKNDTPVGRRNIHPKNVTSMKAAVTKNKDQQNKVAQIKNNQPMLRKQKNSSEQGKKSNIKDSVGLKDAADEGDDDEEVDDDDEEDDDDDMDDDGNEEAYEKAVKQKNTDLKKKKQIIPESGKKGKQSGLQVENDSTNNYLNAERDGRLLCIKGFSNDMKPEDIKALSPDILDVLRYTIVKQNRMVYGFLEFENEEKAEENHKKLQDKKLAGNKIIVDFCGAKSKKTSYDINPSNIVKNTLICEGIPVDCTIKDIAPLFPKAVSLSLNSSSDYRIAHAVFRSDEDAAEAFKANGKAMIRGKSVTVLFHIKKGKFQQNNKRRRPFPDQRGGKRFRK